MWNDFITWLAQPAILSLALGLLASGITALLARQEMVRKRVEKKQEASDKKHLECERELARMQERCKHLEADVSELQGWRRGQTEPKRRR